MSEVMKGFRIHIVLLAHIEFKLYWSNEIPTLRESQIELYQFPEEKFAYRRPTFTRFKMQNSLNVVTFFFRMLNMNMNMKISVISIV
jgi:hypothetical protein